MPTRTITLTNHDQIRRWAEARGGKPSAVIRTARKNDPGILRIDFPGYEGEGSLEEIEWDEFFAKFEAAKLALVVQEKTLRGQKSNFNRLVLRATIKPGRRGTARKKATAKRTVRARTAPKRTPKKKATTARPKARTVRATRTTRTKKATARRSPSRGRRASTRR